MERRSRAVAAVVIAIVFGAAVLAGCGTSTGDEDGGKGPKATTTTEATTTTTTTTAPDPNAPDPVLFEISSIAGTSNGPTKPSVAELPAARITDITTYHWNDAQGATPGTIALEAEDGTVYGPFQTEGADGQGGVPNAYWIAKVDVEVPAGTYTVIDSDPATWSWAPDTDERGMVTIRGVER